MHVFGALFGVVGVDVGESHIFWLGVLPQMCFYLHTEANHELVDKHPNDGANKWDNKGHQEPAVSKSVERQKNGNYTKCNVFDY